MGDTCVKFDFPFFDCAEYGFFPYDVGACCEGGLACGGVPGSYDADSDVGFDGMGEAETVTDYGAVFGGFETEVEFVFGAGGGAADFRGEEVSII